APTGEAPKSEGESQTTAAESSSVPEVSQVPSESANETTAAVSTYEGAGARNSVGLLLVGAAALLL
ncbi:hypothetical protein K4G61_g5106, partial [Candida parapsilosis]